jgi:hypothetical protein
LGIRVPAPALRIVSDALWNEDQTRADDIRAAYLHATNGTAWGRPTNATEPKASCVLLARGMGATLPMNFVGFGSTAPLTRNRLGWLEWAVLPECRLSVALTPE